MEVYLVNMNYTILFFILIQYLYNICISLEDQG